MSQHSTYTRTAIIRTEADLRIGYGKVMRCLALAVALSGANYRSVFLLSNPDVEIKKEIEKRGQLFRELPDQITPEHELSYLHALLEEYDSDLFIGDTGFVNSDYLKKVAEQGVYTVSIDDNGAFDCPSDLLLNPNLYARRADYPAKSPGQLLLGPEYALLREEFVAGRYFINPAAVKEKVEVVLVTLGGTDPENQTEKVLTALENSHKAEVIILVLGTGFPHQKELLKRIKSSPKTVIPFIGAVDLAQLMLFCDLAVSGGGLTCYELACLGVPNLILVLKENQQKNAGELEKLGISVNLGRAEAQSCLGIQTAFEALALDREKRQLMTNAGKKLVDGKGSKRTVEKIMELTSQIKVGKKGNFH